MQGWVEPIDQALDHMTSVAGQGAASTPLMRSLIEIAASPELHAAQHRTLVIVSDGLEKSDALSHYAKKWPSVGELRAQNQDVAKVDAVLAGVDVVFFLFDNPEAQPFQTPKHAQFWHDWFKITGADFQFRRF